MKCRSIYWLILFTSFFSAVSVSYAEKVPLVDDVRYIPGPGPSTVRIEYQEKNSPIFKVEQRKETNQVILHIQGAQIPAALARIIDVSSIPGPVQKIIPLNEGGKDIASRIIIQLREPAAMHESGIQGQYELQIMKKASASIAEHAADSKYLQDSRPTLSGTRSWTEGDSLLHLSAAEDKSAEIAKDLIATLDARDEDKVYKGKKITIEAADVSVHDIFRLIGAASGLNIFTSDDVQGNVKGLSFHDVPWDQVLDIVLRSKSLKAVASGNVVRILTLDAYQKEQKAQQDVKLMELKLAPVMMAIIPLSYAQAKDVKTLVEQLLADQNKAKIDEAIKKGIEVKVDDSGEAFVRGKIEIDARTNSIIVTHTAAEIERIKKFIKEIDVAIPQVLIEAKFVEATDDFSKTVGVTWGAFNSSTTNGLNRQTALAAVGAQGVSGVTPVLSLSDPVSATADNGTRGINFGSVFSKVGLANNLSINLQLQELDSQTKVIASPRIIVNNNTQAEIKDGKSIQQPNGTTTTTGTVTTTTTVSYVDVYLDLKVTPQIAGTGKLVMQLNIANDVPGPGNVTINKKAINTTVMMDSGATLVLGGVYSYTLTDVSGGVPFLKDLPILGPLFRRDANTYEKRELLVFLTPRILGMDGSFLGESTGFTQ